MCTTQAPPSTDLVAERIWSGTGLVNTSPGAAASSMPAPTKPPCRGSCPDPPPLIRPTLPLRGASARTTIWFSRSTRRSEWAAATPARASRTTSSGALMNFFTATPCGCAFVITETGSERMPAVSRVSRTHHAVLHPSTRLRDDPAEHRAPAAEVAAEQFRGLADLHRVRLPTVRGEHPLDRSDHTDRADDAVAVE